jgi:3-dehydroquinate synthase
LNKQKIHTISIDLGKRSYPIYIGSGLISVVGDFFSKHRIQRSVVIITDENIAKLYLFAVKRNLTKKGFAVRSIVLLAGEKQKNIKTAYSIYTKLLEWKIDRRSTIVALGGGVIGDLAGYIAATYLRGIEFVQIPTSLLAQVDSSVGGKVGINHHIAKNMIGAFYQPKFVLADIDTLKSLPKREIICGLGEIVKYGIIMNRPFFNYIEEHIDEALANDSNVLFHCVKESCSMKAYVVSKDEREGGLRAILNFGHTVGHAFEQAGKYSIFKHGEAILYGMIVETDIAVNKSLLSETERERINLIIGQIPLPKISKLNFTSAQLIQTMKNDKKSTTESIRMVLPKKIGKTTLSIPVDEERIKESIEYVKNFSHS